MLKKKIIKYYLFSYVLIFFTENLQCQISPAYYGFSHSSTTSGSSNNGLTSESASSSAYQIKQDFPNSIDGLYWISNNNINGGIPFQIFRYDN